MNPLATHTTDIPGLLLLDLPVHGDDRGWFKENWQREKMTSLGVPDFAPVQNNISFNAAVGTTRGIHAEPWDKFVSVASGRIFAAWVDLREGEHYGTVVTAEVSPHQAAFVPRGVGNGFQTLEENTVYTYLVTAHWSPHANYCLVNAADPALAIDWPIPLANAERSEKDMHHPVIADATPVEPLRILVIGAHGQLGKALAAAYGDDPRYEFAGRGEFDLTQDRLAEARDWSQYAVIINAAAYTAVDAAETAESQAWTINAHAVAQLAEISRQHSLTLVHISSDYVFDGTASGSYSETDVPTPISVYGQSKAAGEYAAKAAPKHYILRTSWVIGDGKNFVSTMRDLARRGIDPTVVNDQRGRLTFTTDLVAGIDHLLSKQPAYGVYHLTGSGDAMSWADIARQVFLLTGHDPQRVSESSTAEYFAHATTPIAPRPANSVLDLTKIRNTGFEPKNMISSLKAYLASQ